MGVVREGLEQLQAWVKRAVPTVSDDASRATAQVMAPKLAQDSLVLSQKARSLAESKALKLVSRTSKPLKAQRVQLHPEVAKAWNQSKANAARLKSETLDQLTEKFGDRLKAEAKYDALYQRVRKDMFIAANYPGSSLLNAIREGRIRSLYDLSLKDQVSHKGALYTAARNLADMRLGLREHNPLYVTLGGNRKFAKDIAKYGDVMVRYKEAELAGRVLFSDGNHNYYAKNLFARRDFAQSRFTYFDAPHLVVNRMVKEGLDPKEASRLIEGIVYGGINPARSAEAIKVLNPQAASEALLEAVRTKGIRVLA